MGVLIFLAGIAVNVDSGVWMIMTGFTLLWGALALFANLKHWFLLSGLSFFLMVILTIGSFDTLWPIHPLGFLIEITGVGWVVYQIGKEHTPITDKLKDVLVPLLPHGKWICVPLAIITTLLLAKSPLAAFIIGFSITAYLDRALLKVKGLSRVATLLIVFLVGFTILLAIILKIDAEYNDYDLLRSLDISRDAFIFLRDVLRFL
ncbi:MAG: hypothetical protein WD883_00530 [Candidatus Colwellbacteria bacterium]